MTNILLAALIRNELFLNCLYRVLVEACRSPRVPIPIKNSVTSGLLYIGGIHAGCATASLMWLSVALLRSKSAGGHGVLLAVVSTILVQLVVMCMTARREIRNTRHNLFEYVHRFCGWSALVLLWVHVLLTIRWSPDSAGKGFSLTSATQTASLWLVAVITALVLSPWLTVRKVRVRSWVASQAVVEIVFSGHARAGMFGRISRRALSDWHSFALVSGGQAEASHMMVISSVGDFTKGLITDPPAALYVRKLKFPGLPYCVPMYRRSIIIASGAGMAPYVSLLSTLPRGRHRLIWIGRSFETYFGKDLCDMIFRWPDLVLVDTTDKGRPDLAALAIDNYRSFDADVVFVGSNPEGTRQIVSRCRDAGIPAFGPSWDS